MSSVLSLQYSDGVKRVLPLILNSKDDVLRHYPLIAGIAFREFGAEPEKIASEISQITRPKEMAKDEIYVTVESGTLTSSVDSKYLAGRALHGS